MVVGKVLMFRWLMREEVTQMVFVSERGKVLSVAEQASEQTFETL